VVDAVAIGEPVEPAPVPVDSVDVLEPVLDNWDEAVVSESVELAVDVSEAVSVPPSTALTFKSVVPVGMAIATAAMRKARPSLMRSIFFLACSFNECW
jgi:hypothetical protein